VPSWIGDCTLTVRARVRGLRRIRITPQEHCAVSSKQFSLPGGAGRDRAVFVKAARLALFVHHGRRLFTCPKD
jgi:hypothetical protein